MAISGFLGRANLKKIDVELRLPEEIYAGAPFPLIVHIRNRRRFLPLFLIRVAMNDMHCMFPFLDAGQEAQRSVMIDFDRRGRHSLQDVFICSVFPFHFFSRCSRVKFHKDCIVFPRVKRGPLLQSTGKTSRSQSGEQTRDVVGFDSESTSVRNYVQGDPLKFIHWKASARTGALKTKEFASLAFEPVVIDFAKVTATDMEERISLVTGAILQLQKRGIPVGLSIAGRFFRPTLSHQQRREMFAVLAVYDHD